MPFFYITISERHVVTYKVLADNRAHLDAMLEEQDPSTDDIVDEEVVGSDLVGIVEIAQ
jgi:hypothetical protein